MKNIKIFSFLALLISLGFSSCFTDLLDPVPETAISDLSAFDTKDRIEAQVNGIYSSFKHGQYLGGRYQVYNDIRGDDWLNLQQNGVTGLLTWNHTLTSSANEVQNLWGQIYAAVNRVNMFVDGLAENQSRLLDEGIMTQEEINQFRGEALALRGMAYHHLIQLYAQPYNKNPNDWGAILRITAQRSSADNDMARSTLEETYAQILSDLNEAENLLPERSGANNALSVTRMHKGTVIALKTRVYLHMSRYGDVIAEANKIVSASAPFTSPSGVQYALHGNFEEVFSNYTSSEAIFSIPMTPTEQPGTQNGLAHYFSASPIGNNEYAINQSGPLWTSSAFMETDHRKTLVQERTIQGVDHLFIDKYKESPHLDWAPVIRYAEVLLNLAEAEARQNGVSARALALLNAVYLRSNPEALPLDGFGSADSFIARVMLERNMEFLGEGIRNMDTQRTVSSHGAKENVGAVGPSDNRYVWPIPQTELNTNNLVQQN